MKSYEFDECHMFQLAKGTSKVIFLMIDKV